MSDLLFRQSKQDLAYSQSLRDKLMASKPVDFGALQMQQEPIAPSVPPSFQRAQSLQLPQQSPMLQSSTPTTPDWNSYQNKNTPLQNVATQGRLPMTQQIARGVSNFFQSFRPKTQGEARDMGLVGADPTAPYDAPTMPGQALIDATGFAGPMKQVGGLTIKSLQRLAQEVKAPQVSKQYLLDLIQRPDVKQAERNLMQKFIDEEGDMVDPATFASKVKSELLPLKRLDGGADDEIFDGRNYQKGYKYENITLPDELRGPVANYSEHVYASPVKTSAGSVHGFDDVSDSYFAHTRIEDLPGNEADIGAALAAGKLKGLKDMESVLSSGGTRRVIEIQSDLFQKGRLEGELSKYQQSKYLEDFLPEAQKRELYQLQQKKDILTKSGRAEEFTAAQQKRLEFLEKEGERLYKEAPLKREAEIAKLEPYRNTWWERIIREEVKQAAKDGKTKLQFPTGETAMKIEGLGERDTWVTQRQTRIGDTDYPEDLFLGREVQPEVGMTIERTEGPDTYRRESGHNEWVVTEVLPNGRFKAVDDLVAQNDYRLYEYLKKEGLLDDGRMPSVSELFGVVGDGDEEMMKHLNRLSEQFDISGKVDTNNPIYRFYEKDVQRYLKNKYGAKVVTDPQGVQWIELDVPKDAAKLPVEAFGAGALGASTLDDE
jgi:hypothetical protein